jgi:pimeloyl-ACP methyl ester carboxylesterase
LIPKKNIYVFSGLGADERVFKHIDLSPHNIMFMPWIKPMDKEAIEDYAARLCQLILTPDPILIGLSFGGIIAVEAAKKIAPEKLVLISSTKTRMELPFYFRIAGLLKLYKLVPASFYMNPGRFIHWMFGASTIEDKTLLNQIMNDTDPRFLQWALNSAMEWKNNSKPENVYHIHGSMDRILPASFVDYDSLVRKGGHLMILNRAMEVTNLLRQIIDLK